MMILVQVNTAHHVGNIRNHLAGKVQDLLLFESFILLARLRNYFGWLNFSREVTTESRRVIIQHSRVAT